MGLKELVASVKEKFSRREEKIDVPDDVTTDRDLRSLRRERRTQHEVIEKERLKRDIAEFKKQQTRRNMYGRATTLVEKALGASGGVHSYAPMRSRLKKKLRTAKVRHAQSYRAQSYEPHNVLDNQSAILNHGSKIIPRDEKKIKPTFLSKGGFL